MQCAITLYNCHPPTSSPATDMDFNIQLEAKAPLSDSVMFKSNASMREEGSVAQGGVYYSGKSTAASLDYTYSSTPSSTLSYTQVGE